MSPNEIFEEFLEIFQDFCMFQVMSEYTVSIDKYISIKDLEYLFLNKFCSILNANLFTFIVEMQMKS